MYCVCGRLTDKQRQMNVFHKVVRQHYSDELGDFIIFRCEIFSGYIYTLKLLKSIQLLTRYSKYKMEDVFRHGVHVALNPIASMILNRQINRTQATAN